MPGKKCPLLIAAKLPTSADCQGDSCAWFVAGECAVVRLAAAVRTKTGADVSVDEQFARDLELM